MSDPSTVKPAPGLSISSLPPYGLVNAENAAFLARRPVPERFREPPDQKLPSPSDEWESWLSALAQEMSDFLWPLYRDGAWVGAAAAHAIELTLADLQLMKTLQGRMDVRIKNESSVTGTHFDAFKQEDEAMPGPTFGFYQSKFPKLLEAEMVRAFIAGGRDIARPASQGLKKVLQRPRPQLTAYLLGYEDFNVQASATAITPSMISGHCIQGTMALAEVEFKMGEVLRGTQCLLEDMRRFLIDTGDRRVFAGLHYPSDNVGSWFVAMRLCRHVYGQNAEQVRSGLWEAIQKHSVVYQAMLAASRTKDSGKSEASPYALPLRRLEEAANGAEFRRPS